MHGLEYEIQAKPGYHCFVCRGAISTEGLHWLIGEIVTKTDKSQRMILVELDGMPGNLDTLSRHELGLAVAEKLMEKRIALIADKEKINKVGENTATNRGANLLATHDRAAALEWLLKPVEHAPEIQGPA